MAKIKIFVTVFLVFLFTKTVYSQTVGELYGLGLSYSRSGETDAAFMYFHACVNERFSKSKSVEAALFAVGEYYFSTADYFDAFGAFRRFVNDYPKSKALPFAFIYLAKIARSQGKDALAKDFEKEVIRFKQTSLLFKEFKEHKYVSSLLKKYKARYFIDKIEIYINNGLFAEISL